MTSQDVHVHRIQSIGRPTWSLNYQESQMAVGLGTRQAADEEARAEVEVLNSRLEKTRILNAKLAASLQRLEVTGKSVQNAIGPLAGNTNELRVVTRNIDAINKAIERIRQPSDVNKNEEEIIRRGPGNGQLSQHLGSVRRLDRNLAELQQTKLRSNEKRVAETVQLLKMGNSQLETYFKQILQGESTTQEAAHFVANKRPFPNLTPDTANKLSLIIQHMAPSPMQNGALAGSPMIQAYASVRGPYLTATLANLAFSSLTTMKKKNQDDLYQPMTNSIGNYTLGMRGAFLAEYENICVLFTRDEWSQAFNLTTQRAISELAQTLINLDAHIKSNLNTDCCLAYEIIAFMSLMSSELGERTGELKSSFAAALKPVRQTGKASFKTMFEDTIARIVALQALPVDGAALPMTSETMTRLQSMTNFLAPISSLMLSIGDSGWKAMAPSKSSYSTDQVPTLNSFDVSADGKQIFVNYCFDTINALLKGLSDKTQALSKNKSVTGVFVLNNLAVVDRMVKYSELKPLLEPAPRMAELEKFRKSGAKDYSSPWEALCKQLMDSLHTNRAGARPTSGSASAVDSMSILKSLSSKEKEGIKEKFRVFNTVFDELVQKHKSLAMEKEVRVMLARDVQQMIEVLYHRFWDRYHEIDKGKGKYVKYDKAAISAIFISMGS